MLERVDGLSVGHAFPRDSPPIRTAAHCESGWHFVLKSNTRDSLKMTHILHMAEDTAGEGTTF